jgi:hypothetical protein
MHRSPAETGSCAHIRVEIRRRFKELIRFRGFWAQRSRARMMAQVPMAPARLAGFPESRAAGLERFPGLQRVVEELPPVASFGLPSLRLSWLRICACGFSRPSAPPLDVSVWQQPSWLRRGVCGLGQLSPHQPDALQRSVCGLLRLSFLRSSAWGSSLPPLRLREGIKPEVACLCKTWLWRGLMHTCLLQLMRTALCLVITCLLAVHPFPSFPLESVRTRLPLRILF